MSRKVIAVINQKGGVGKTTTAINVASYLVKSGKTVLLIDLDPQGNATSGLGINKNQVENTIYDCLSGDAEVADCIVTSSSGVHLIPSNANLAGIEIELSSATERHKKLAQVTQLLDFDVVIIDCPPSLGLLTINALTASSHVLIPVQTEFYALEGLSQLVQIIHKIKADYNPDLELLGVVLTMYDGRTSLAEQVVAEVEKHFGKKVFKSKIPRNVRLAEAPSYGKSIIEHDKWSKGSRAYKSLSREVLQRVTEA